MDNYKTIFIGNWKFLMPFHISQLTSKQFLLLLSISQLNLTPEELQLQLFISLLNTPENWRNVIKLRCFWLKNLVIIPFLDWLTFGKFDWKKEVIDSETLNFYAKKFTEFYFNQDVCLNVNPMKRIYGKRFTFLKKLFRMYDKSRPDTLSDFKLKDFIETEEAYFQYVSTKDEEQLTKIIRVLYNNPKIKTDEHDIQTRRAIQLYYEGVKKFIVETFNETYRTRKKSANDASSDNPFMNLVHVLAKEDPSYYEKITNSALWDCLYATEQKMKLMPD